MYTQCPHCQTCFRVSEAHLKAAKGRVRCGSCQEVFDARQYLYNNLTDKQPVARPQKTPPAAAPLPEHETEHIDLSAPPAAQQTEQLRQERRTAPDQTRFMESLTDNDRYNNLDDMGSISIPGELKFSDSFIQHPPAETERETAANPPPTPPNAYEDVESKEAPATDADRASIQSLFAAADNQMREDNEKSQLDRDIDELLAFADNFNQQDEAEPPARASSAKRPAKAKPDDFDLEELNAFEEELLARAVAEAHKPLPAADEKPEMETEPDSEMPARSEPEPVAKPTQRSSSLDEDIPRALRRSLDNLNAMPSRSLGQTIGLLSLVVLLLGGLAFQLILFRNVEITRLFPSLTPVISAACEALPCRYAGQADVRQIRLLTRDVRSHPTQKNALLISAAFVNEAAYDQPYPNIQITLSDLGGNVVASRRFTPQEYLEDMYNRFILLESGTPVHVTLAVLDPGSDAINFEFSFL